MVKQMSKVATRSDYIAGKNILYWGEWYRPVWISDTHVCLCLPGCIPGMWRHIDPQAIFSKPTSVVIPLNCQHAIVFD